MPDDFKPELRPVVNEDGGSPRESLPVPGFWKRLLIFALDTALLIFLVYFFSKYFYTVLYPLGAALQWIVLVLVYVYFAVCATGVTKGKTLARHILKYRLVTLDGQYLSPGKAAIRAIFDCAIVYAIIVILGRRILPNHMMMFPRDLEHRVVLLSLAYISAAYAAGTALFCSGHPKKRAVHDLVPASFVVKEAKLEEGVAFMNEWSSSDLTRLKNARIPAAIMFLIILVLFFQVRWKADAWIGSVPWDVTNLEALDAAHQKLDTEDFKLFYVVGPSEQMAQLFDERLASEQQQRRLAEEDLLTTDVLKGLVDGRKFYFAFSCDEQMTTETLLQNPQYYEIIERSQAVAMDLSQQYYLEEDERPSYYDSILVEFWETLPASLFFRNHLVDMKVIDIEPPYPKPTPAPVDEDSETTDTSGL
ncbi:MAG: RDD family protein [Candidatus Sumerlaeia bacterium]